MLANKQSFIITEKTSKQRLDKALAEHPLVKTRSRASKLIQRGLVKCQGKTVKPSMITEVGEVYELELPTDVSTELTSYDLSLDIHYEDDDLIVINKPSGLVVHPSHGHEDKTLVNALLNHCDNLSMGFAERRPGIVHRLDKDTSGLMVVAKNDEAHFSLAEQFKEKSVIRRYKAICYGYPKKAIKRIESSLIRHPIHRKKYCSETPKEGQEFKGKWAATNIEFIDDFKQQVTLFYCKLETGRTHQIRVHLSEAGFPLVNDPIYLSSGRKKVVKSKELVKVINDVQRLGLHAFELGFKHPKTQKDLYFQQPWPDDLMTLVNYLGFNEK